MLKSLLRPLLLGSLFVFSHANAGLITADFEQFDEGFFLDSNNFVLPTFTDNGIDFFGFEEFEDEPSAPFIDRIGGTFIVDIPETNVLAVGGGSPGISFGIGRVAEFSFSFGGALAQFASVDVIDGFFGTTDAILNIETLLGGNVVSTNALLFDTNPGPFRQRTLAVGGGLFDSVRLSVFDPNQSGLFASFDNVVVDLVDVPEPPAIMLLCGSLVGLMITRQRKKRIK